MFKSIVWSITNRNVLHKRSKRLKILLNSEKCSIVKRNLHFKVIPSKSKLTNDVSSNKLKKTELKSNENNLVFAVTYGSKPGIYRNNKDFKRHLKFKNGEEGLGRVFKSEELAINYFSDMTCLETGFKKYHKKEDKISFKVKKREKCYAVAFGLSPGIYQNELDFIKYLGSGLGKRCISNEEAKEYISDMSCFKTGFAKYHNSSDKAFRNTKKILERQGLLISNHIVKVKDVDVVEREGTVKEKGELLLNKTNEVEDLYDSERKATSNLGLGLGKRFDSEEEAKEYISDMSCLKRGFAKYYNPLANPFEAKEVNVSERNIKSIEEREMVPKNISDAVDVNVSEKEARAREERELLVNNITNEVEDIIGSERKVRPIEKNETSIKNSTKLEDVNISEKEAQAREREESENLQKNISELEDVNISEKEAKIREKLETLLENITKAAEVSVSEREAKVRVEHEKINAEEVTTSERQLSANDKFQFALKILTYIATIENIEELVQKIKKPAVLNQIVVIKKATNEISFFTDGSFQSSLKCGGWAFSCYINGKNVGYRVGTISSTVEKKILENLNAVGSTTTEIVGVGEVFKSLAKSEALQIYLKQFTSLIVINCDNTSTIKYFQKGVAEADGNSLELIKYYLTYKEQMEKNGFLIFINYVSGTKKCEGQTFVHKLAKNSYRDSKTKSKWDI